MRIFPVSDIHTEFHKDDGKTFIKSMAARKDVDVLVIAGDAGTKRRDRKNKPNYAAMISALCKIFPQVIYCLGNHEYYDTADIRIPVLAARDLAAKIPNLHFLDRDTCEIDGVRFVGTTMWFPDNPLAFGARKGMSDFDYIPGFAAWVAAENTRCVKFLRQTMKPGDVVVTHHLPSFRSVDPKYIDSSLNPFYVCDMSKDIMRSKPALWIHGHCHVAVDYHVGDTRVTSNPFGYIHRNETYGFDWNRSIDMGR